MAFDVTDFTDAPTNPELVVTGYSTSTDRMVCAILPDDSTHTSITYEYLGGADTDYATQATTEGFRLKCYDALTTDGLQFNPTDFATRNYYVLINSDFSETHHFAKIKEIHSEDTTGDSFEFEPKLGNEIPKGTKFRIIKGELKTVDIIALTAGIKRNLSSSLVVARPIFYFKDSLDKKDELDHNTKYFASIDGGTVTSFTLNDASSQDVVFRTVQDFGNSIVDYSKYSLKVTLTDILRQLDNDVSGSITDNEGRSFTFDADDYDDVFPNARREANDSFISRSFTGAIRYAHYDYSPTKANIAYGVFRHENTESVGGKGGFSESSIVDNNRIMSKKIEEFYDYRVRHRIHDGDVDDWFALDATFQSESSPSNYIFETEYDLGTVFNVGDELKLDDKILIVDTIGTLSGTTQTITFRVEIRTESTGIFAPEPSFTPTADSILYRRAYNPTDKTLMLDMDLIDSRFSKLHIMFYDKNFNELFATVTACDETKKMLTLSFSEDSYTSNALEYCLGQYSVFVERFSGEIEEIEIKKEQGQTIFEIKGRDKFTKLLSPIINKDTLFTEDVVYSSDSPYNKLGQITSTNYSLSIGDTELLTNAAPLSFTNLPAIGDKLFSENGFIGKVTDNTRTHSGDKVALDITASMVELDTEKVYVNTEKNYMFLKSLGASHLAEANPTSLTGSANKGAIFTSGQIIDITDGSEDGTLIGTSNNDNPEAVGYSINSPSHVSLDRNFQARLKDEFGDNSFSTFDTVNTLMDFEVVSKTKKGNLTELEIAPYIPITLGRKVNYHFDSSDYTFTSLGTVVNVASLATRGDFFVSVNGTEAYNLEIGDNIFVQADGSTTKKYVGQLVNTEIQTIGGTVEVYLILDRDVHNFVGTSGSEDTLFKGVKPTNDIAFVNGKHLWGGKIVTVPHPKTHSTFGSVPLNVENPNGTLDYNKKHGQMYYKSTGMIYGNFDTNNPPINITIGSGGIFPNQTIPVLYKEKSLLNYYTSNYQIKPNISSTNFTNFDTTDSSFRTLPLDMRGHTSPFGSNGTNVRVYETDLSNLIVRYYSPVLINTFLQTDMSALRLFLYVNSDLLPYSKLRKDSLSGKTLNNYNIFALENKETKDRQVDNGNRLRLKDNNFQTLSFTSEQDVGNLTQFGIMRLTEVCFDYLFNPVNPEKPISKIERAYNIAYDTSDTLQGDPEVYDLTTVVPSVHSLSGTTLTFSSDASSYVNVNDFIYDASNGNFVGKIASKTSNTVWELTANGYFTRNGSAPLNVVAATGTRADFYGRALQDTYEDFASNNNKRGIHPLKCVINPEYANYGKEYGSDSDALPAETEIILPIAINNGGSEYTAYSTADCHMIRPMKNVFNTGNYGYDGMIGVVLDTFEIEDGRSKEANVGDTTQVLKGNGVVEITANSGRMPTILAESHFKEKDNPDDNASTTGVNHNTAPYPVDGAFMVFKPRLWTATGATRTTTKSSNGNLNKTVLSISGGNNRFLEYIDLTGCYLVPEVGTKLDNTSITTGTQYSSNRMVDVMPEELIYVISHEVDDSTITDHILITDAELDDNKGYRILQPNETCMYNFFPKEIYMNTLKPSYTKISNGDSTYEFDSSYFYEESTKSSGLNTIENEGVLSMFVAIDLDGVSTDDGIVIKNRKNFFDNVLSIGNHSLYFSDGDNSKKITVSANQNYSITLSEGFYGKGVVSVSEPFTVSSREELLIDPDRLVIGTTASIGLEAEDLINELLEDNEIDFEVTQNDYPYYLAPNYKGMDLYSAINLILDRKDMTLIEENGTFKISPEDDSSHYSNILINDSGDFQIFEFQETSSLFDFFNDIIVYGRTHKSNRKDLRSIQKRGRKTLEVVDDSLITQNEVDRKSLQLLLLHSQFNKKIRFTLSSQGIHQLRVGDVISVEIPRENIDLNQYIVLEIKHELTGLMTIELGRYIKDLSDLFSELLLANKETKSFFRSDSFDEKASTYNFLEEVKLKELRLLVRKRTTTGAYRIGFDGTLGTTTNTIGFNGGTVTTTTLIDEDLT